MKRNNSVRFKERRFHVARLLRAYDNAVDIAKQLEETLLASTDLPGDVDDENFGKTVKWRLIYGADYPVDARAAMLISDEVAKKAAEIDAEALAADDDVVDEYVYSWSLPYIKALAVESGKIWRDMIQGGSFSLEELEKRLYTAEKDVRNYVNCRHDDWELNITFFKRAVDYGEDAGDMATLDDSVEYKTKRLRVARLLRAFDEARDTVEQLEKALVAASVLPGSINDDDYKDTLLYNIINDPDFPVDARAAMLISDDVAEKAAEVKNEEDINTIKYRISVPYICKMVQEAHRVGEVDLLRTASAQPEKYWECHTRADVVMNIFETDPDIVDDNYLTAEEKAPWTYDL